MEKILKGAKLLAIVFSALALSTTSAHLLEFPQKIGLDIRTYAIINDQLYRFYAIAGGAYCMLAIAFAALLAWYTRRILSFRWYLAGLIMHLCWLLSWLLIVLPVNKTVAAVSGLAQRSELWSSLRFRWEWGHIVGFVFHLLALCFLIAGILNVSTKKSA